MAKEKKSTHVEQETTAGRDELATYLQKALNARRKDGQKVAFFLDENEDPSNITEWVSTGNELLDLAICNRPHAGLPVGRISEINGLEQTSKTLTCAHIMANTQRQGGQAVMIDPEFAGSKDFWAALGVNIKNMVYLPVNCLEDMLQGIEDIIGEIRKKESNRLITIITDSIASVPTKKELETDYNQLGYNTDKSKLLSLGLRRITGLLARQRICAVFTNQLRQNLKATAFADPYIEPGGMAFRYHASVRIRLKNIGRVTDAAKNIIGRTVQAQVTKTRFGPPLRTATFDVRFDSGIQNLESWLNFMKDRGMITGTKAGFTFKFLDNQIIKADKFVELASSDASFKEKVYQAICDNYIMSYKTPDSQIAEEVEHAEGDDDELAAKEAKEVKEDTE